MLRPNLQRSRSTLYVEGLPPEADNLHLAHRTVGPLATESPATIAWRNQVTTIRLLAWIFVSQLLVLALRPVTWLPLTCVSIFFIVIIGPEFVAATDMRRL